MSVRCLGKRELRTGLVARRPGDHKGIFGHVLVVAGSRGMAGAAILAARGALRSGAGLITVAAPAGIAALIAGALPSAMTLALPENKEGTFRLEGVDLLKNYSKERGVATLAIGPGMTAHADVERFVVRVLATIPVAAVIDADALNILAHQELADAARILQERKRSCVFTPHPAEAARMLKITNFEVAAHRRKSVERLARSLGGVVLLKGCKTLISSGARTIANSTGGPGLAKAGSGDVLTGLIAGLWAQMIASGRVFGDLPFIAATLGAWLHGAAGDAAEKELTEWAMTSTDLVDYLPHAFKALRARIPPWP